MDCCLVLLLLDGSLLAIGLLVVFWKYLLAAVGIAVGLYLATWIQTRLERRRHLNKP